MPKPILVSACLLGLDTRYNGRTKYNAKVVDYLHRNGYIPVPICPEQLAGLPTPRPATEFISGDGREVLDGSGRVCNRAGVDVSDRFCKGAAETLKIAELAGCQTAILKERSPSCGVNWVYRQGKLTTGRGVTTALLQKHRIAIRSEEEVPES